MFEAILRGQKPSRLFHEIVRADPSVSNSQLSKLFREEFENLDGLAAQIIWKWKRPGKEHGLDDKSVDAELIKLLKEAGYI